MKKKTFTDLGIGLIISIFIAFSCKDKTENDDNISGKWIDFAILNDTLTTPCQKASFIQYAPYTIDLKDRKVYQCNACDTPIVSTQIANYTIVGDTLRIIDMNHITTEHIISYIKKDYMSIKTLNVLTGVYNSRVYKRISF